ncbi:MAG: oxidoreductase FAD/NAD(P)-binding protein [Novosphingobium lindaniclasticum]|jgi:ferredoxin--NADP+ reductase|uniref:ferredoxin--NADP(+) reductase n=1 Tax=Novosphingobium lindaniclasticum LE124 TaxID=1096930 RepID=T0I4M5_9SPHN|nr:FAD-binding oxidoreductase [Novosphingobium lindaniclasticum]EQB19318.1 ferredoxin--NADP reductase [Novosphingobium lindaniclasticum LE124]MDF2637973.1 oxidoreductase FAD/NAD(P)-binding protein [Novosphingobium lindaniclasticum]
MSDGQAVMAPLEPTTALTVEEVLTVRHWNEHLFSFTMSRPASFRFRSGEFVMLGLQGEKRPLLRAYSIASPSWAEEIEFLSIKVPDGPLTSRLQLVQPGDQIYLGRKPTGTLVTDALLPGKRLFMLSTGTGLAPFMSLIRDPDVYDLYDEVIVVHCVRRVSDLAYREELESQLAEDPLVSEQALVQLHYVPTVTREPFHTTGRIGALVESGRLFEGLKGDQRFNPETDRVMLCGSMDMIKDFSADLESWGFTEGSNAKPGDFVIERAFVG